MCKYRYNKHLLYWSSWMLIPEDGMKIQGCLEAPPRLEKETCPVWPQGLCCFCALEWWRFHMSTKSKGQTLPLGSRESFTWIILTKELQRTRSLDDGENFYLSCGSYKHHLLHNQPWSLVVDMYKHVTSHCQVPCSCSNWPAKACWKHLVFGQVLYMVPLGRHFRDIRDGVSVPGTSIPQ